MYTWADTHTQSQRKLIMIKMEDDPEDSISASIDGYDVKKMTMATNPRAILLEGADEDKEEDQVIINPDMPLAPKEESGTSIFPLSMNSASSSMDHNQHSVHNI